MVRSGPLKRACSYFNGTFNGGTGFAIVVLRRRENGKSRDILMGSDVTCTCTASPRLDNRTMSLKCLSNCGLKFEQVELSASQGCAVCPPPVSRHLIVGSQLSNEIVYHSVTS
ncbi:hypothetical protein B5X24_HaOG205543 [Helicoverpa armigera]|nr:hypothetical protein B5X24_HaOG205543 [Helicoverpa armigera]